MMNYIVKPTVVMVVCTFIIWFFYWMRTKSSYKAENNQRALYKGLLLAYIAGLISVTLVPYPHFIHAHSPVRVNFIPLVDNIRELKLAINNHSNLLTNNSFENLAGNVLLFIPFGILIPLVWERFRKFYKILLLVLITSLVIELLQVFSSIFKVYRSLDIDDVILDTTGAAIGYGFFILFQKKTGE